MNIIASIELPFGQFLELHQSLRKAGAKFRTSVQGENRIIEFSNLPKEAAILLQNPVQFYNNLPTSETVENPSFLTQEDLMKFTKNQLLELATEYGITVATNQKKAIIAEALEGLIPA